MGNQNQSKPIKRVLLWELAAALGLLRLLQTAPPGDPWTIRFVTNACFFLAAFPLFTLFRHGEPPGLVKLILTPLGFILRIGLVLSAYLWAAFLFWSFKQTDLLKLMFDRPVVLGLLFILLYGAWIRHLWGTAEKPLDGSATVRMTFMTLFAGGIGWVLGKGMDRILSTSFPDPVKRLWIAAVLTLLFAVVGAWIGKSGSRKAVRKNEGN
jgi:hypothetical protein